MDVRFPAAAIHGRYLVERPHGPGPHPLLVGFHGYGESAEQHLEQLRLLPGAGSWVRVAVQSLHLFYTKAGAVVGSWMTRQGRELAIADNVAYVAGVVSQVREEFAAGGPLVYVGFSQGASMAYRAAAHAGHRCQGLIALGGDMPPDVAEDGAAALPPVLAARGQRDEWFTEAKLEQDVERLRARGVAVRRLVFDGGHEWAAPFFDEAGAFLREVLGKA